MIVVLCVGGTDFHTRMPTLTETTTYFSALVAAEPDATRFFVDRDPTHFRHVLNWLRGVRHLPQDDVALAELEWEADFYSMKDMVDAIAFRRSEHRRVPTLAESVSRIANSV